MTEDKIMACQPAWGDGRKRKENMGERDEKEELTLENYWEQIAAHQGEIFYTKSGLSFAYQVVGNELFTDRRQRSINRKSFERAILKLQEHPGEIKGPKALTLYGAPYIWAILNQIGKM